MLCTMWVPKTLTEEQREKHGYITITTQRSHKIVHTWVFENEDKPIQVKKTQNYPQKNDICFLR